MLGGDIILAIAGIPVTGGADLPKIRNHLGSLPANTPFTVRVLREGHVVDVEARLP